MAITHFTPRLITRGSGRSIVAAAAYRHCARMHNEREARTIDYSRKQGLIYEEFMLPADAPPWVRAMVADRSVAGASQAFWNALEAFEKRADAQLAKEYLLALPVELDIEQNIALTRAFVQDHTLPRGMVADWVFHHPPGNPHIHLLTTLRPMLTDGFGDKKVALRGTDGAVVRDSRGQPVYRPWAGDRQTFLELRQSWLDLVNRHLWLAGLDIRVDGRSYLERGIALEPTLHVGPAAKGRSDRGTALAQSTSLQQAQSRRNIIARSVKARPSVIIEALAQERSVFDRHDIARWLHRYFDIGQVDFETTLGAVLRHPELVCLERERIDRDTGAIVPAKFSTRHLISLEAGLATKARAMSKRRHFLCKPGVTKSIIGDHPNLSVEQQDALRHLTGPASLVTVVGRAGAGKTTMMTAARQIWQTSGYTVIGGALAGKAAEGLQEESAIRARTLAAWELAWSRGQDIMTPKTVFVLDEAGMVASGQMADLVARIEAAGAKLVLVGDPDQLQPIAAGAALRTIIAETGYAQLQTIYRQHEQWMRDASMALARGQVGQALSAYQLRGSVNVSRTRSNAMAALVADWMTGFDPDRAQLILAHRRVDVQALNEMVRGALLAAGHLSDGQAFLTHQGKRLFSAGDQIVFLRNDPALGVKNGTRGKVVAASAGELVVAVGAGKTSRHLEVHQHLYADLDYGYATTIHKAQGTTVDKVSLLATATLDRHLTYVALTRHRSELRIFHGAAEFRRQSGLVAALSRPNAKFSTRDFSDSPDYEVAWLYAARRGLHAMRVTQALWHTYSNWILSQARRLAEALEPTRSSNPTNMPLPQIKEEAPVPMFAPVKDYAQTTGQIALAQLKTDAAYRAHVQALQDRFEMIFADGKAAFDRLDLQKALLDPVWQDSMIKQLGSAHAIGQLRGSVAILASKSAKQARQDAVAATKALPQEVEIHLRAATAIYCRYRDVEDNRRARMLVGVRQPSDQAMALLRHHSESTGIDGIFNADPKIKAEIIDLAAALQARFGPTVLHKGAVAERGLLEQVTPTERKALSLMLPLLRSALRLSQTWKGELDQRARHTLSPNGPRV